MSRLSKIGAAALGAFGWTGGAAAVSASYLQVAGGGGGGVYGGGGGAGGLLTGSTSLNATLSYTVIVGAGGAGSSSRASTGTSGGSSSFNTVSTTGGGGGASDNNSSGMSAGNGGSGGGASYAATTSVGTGVSGQGFAGGNATAGGSYPGGGGGGASAVGGNSSSSVGGSGGSGTASSITGSSVTYAGGGGGGAQSSGTVGTGGTGGGGAGGNSSTAPTSGTANLGGGGGGDGAGSTAGKGGSGVVIISYLGAQQFGGGVVTSVGGYTIHTFTTSGTLSPLSILSASYLIVAGGGGGGATAGGGGGAGGLLTGSGLTIDTNSTYLVTVGSGGAAGSGGNGVSGSNSTFALISTAAVGGGGGGFYSNNGLSGGSGGGGGGASGGTTGGSPTSGQGYAGGTGTFSSARTGGGGGGAGAVGSNGNGSSVCGNGGVGVSSSISGTATYYAGGGGGGANDTPPTIGTGGLGGGGNGGKDPTAPTSGTANTGGGGGAGGTSTGAAGGSGIVIISYAGSTQLMAGGTVTIVGGNVIHTFLSSGYLSPLTYVGNSLRFRSSASASLTRTYGTPTNSKIWSFSVWIKRGKLGANQEILNNNSSNAQFYFTSSDTLYFYDATSGADYNTTQVFRDPAAWYHIVVAMDTTQATAGNRTKIYVNGSQVTAFGTATAATQNNNSAYNVASTLFALGVYNPTPSNYFDGYFSETRFIDGQALTPNAFGTFNQYGVWQPIYYGGSYGTNGFYLKFNNTTSTTTLGYDTSPAGNNWATNNISLTAGSTYDAMTDVPTLTSTTAANYAVLNPLQPVVTGMPTPTNGNLTCAIPVNANTVGSIVSTIGVTSGKWYYEFRCPESKNIGGTYLGMGYSPAMFTAVNQYVGNTGFGYGFLVPDTTSSYQANARVNGTNTGIGTAFIASTTDVFMVAADFDNGRMWLGRNGTWLAGDPAAGTGASITGIVTTSPLFPAATTYRDSSWNNTVVANFGQQPFAYTPPSGFVALNTYNL